MNAAAQYAHYVCDECGERIGETGAVTLSRTKPVVVWAARCEEHRKRRASVLAEPTTKETR